MFGLLTQISCSECKMMMAFDWQGGGQTISCTNPSCGQFGKLFLVPKFPLQELASAPLLGQLKGNGG